jgi:hypothetical protein
MTGWEEALFGLKSTARLVQVDAQVARLVFAPEWHLKQTCHWVVASGIAVVLPAAGLYAVAPAQLAPHVVTLTPLEPVITLGSLEMTYLLVDVGAGAQVPAMVMALAVLDWMTADWPAPVPSTMLTLQPAKMFACQLKLVADVKVVVVGAGAAATAAALFRMEMR